MAEEKRDYVRISVFLAPVCCMRSDRECKGITINDISGSGIGITTNEKLVKGDNVDLELNIPEDDIPIFVTGKVTWAEKGKKGDKTYRAGIRFVKMNHCDKDRLMKYMNSNIFPFQTPNE